jgi:division protein CdvB (Snf7/Vps24/ESCRT-III family)
LKLQPFDSFSARLPQLKQKKAEIHVKITNIKSQCAVIRARMQDSPSPGNEHEIRLREILGETPVAMSLPDPDQLRALQKQLEALNAAVSTIDREMLTETRYANNAFLESVRSEINRLGNAFANAFADLHSRHLEYDQFIDSLEDVGASVGQFRIRPNGLSHPKDLSGSYAYGLREFIDAGFFSQSNLPKALR